MEISSEIKISSTWYNYKTSRHDCLCSIPKNFEDYIPQSKIAQILYRCYLSLGDQPYVAAMKVLKAALLNINE